MPSFVFALFLARCSASHPSMTFNASLLASSLALDAPRTGVALGATVPSWSRPVRFSGQVCLQDCSSHLVGVSLFRRPDQLLLAASGCRGARVSMLTRLPPFTELKPSVLLVSAMKDSSPSVHPSGICSLQASQGHSTLGPLSRAAPSPSRLRLPTLLTQGCWVSLAPPPR